MKDKIIFLTCFIICVIVALVGCDIQKRQIRQLDTRAVQYPAEMARLSNLLYPCFTGKAKSDTVIRHDTTAGNIITNTITIKKNDTVYVTTVKDINHYIHDKITIRDTIADARALAALQVNTEQYHTQAIQSQQKLEDALKTAKNRLWILIGLSVALAALTAFNIYKMFTVGKLL